MAFSNPIGDEEITASEEPEESKKSEEPEQLGLRIVLIGKTGAGKSATGNTILGKKVFQSRTGSSTVTAKCTKETGVFDGETLTVVDTPGLFDPVKPPEEVIEEMTKSISKAAPGPHVFLFVLQVNRFTNEENETMKKFLKVFGEKATSYTMALFTHGDDLEEDGVSIEDVIKGNKDLKAFVEQCLGGYHVFNNREKDEEKKKSQVHELLKKIKTMVKSNNGRHYTNALLEEAEKAIKKEMELLQRENPDMKPEEARRRAEENNDLIRTVLRTFLTVAGGAGGGVAGLLSGAQSGAALGMLAGPLGVAVGALLGALLGVAVIATVHKIVEKKKKKKENKKQRNPQ